MGGLASILMKSFSFKNDVWLTIVLLLLFFPKKVDRNNFAMNPVNAFFSEHVIPLVIIYDPKIILLFMPHCLVSFN